MQELDLRDQPADLILRKSRAGDESLEEIFAVHRTRLVELAEQYGLRYNIVEDIISGADTLKADKLFSQVLRRTDAGLTTVWLCMDIDRLARPDPEEAGRILNCWKRNKVHIITPGHIYRPGSFDDEFLLHTKLYIARMELINYKRRVFPTRDDAIRKHSRYSNGAAPFGYRWIGESKSYVPDPIEYPMVEYAWSMIPHHGAGTVRDLVIRRFGNAHRALSAYDGMFHNPFYAGYPCARKQEEHHTRKDTGHWVWPEQPGDYEHPVTLDQWRNIQNIMAMRAIERPKSSETTWARGVLWFADCDTRAHGAGTVYRCDEWKPGVPNHRGCHSLKKSKAHRVIELMISHILAQPALLQELVTRCQAVQEDRTASRADVLDRLRFVDHAIKAREDQLRRLMDAFSLDMGDSALKVLTDQVKEWETEIRELKERGAMLRTQLSMPDISPEIVQAIEAIGRDFGDYWPKLPAPAKKAICELLISRAIVTRSGQYSISRIDYGEQAAAVGIQPPPASLQSEMGALASAYALRCMREGREITPSAFDFTVGCSSYHGKELRRHIRRWLQTPKQG